MNTDVPNGKLPVRTKLLYGIGDVGNAAVNSAVQFFLMIFYTDAALLPAALVGSALLIGKIWDAINDPLFGWVSDRTRSRRFGKRRVFMLTGAIPLGISIMLLWRVPQGLQPFGAFLWVACTFLLFDTVWTLTNVPYYALTAELTDDYDERSSLTAWRMSLAVPAYLVGAALTPVIVALFATKRAGYGAIGVLYGAVAAAALLICAAGIRERKAMAETRAETAPLKTFVQTFKNRPFVRLLSAYLVLNLAFALIKTLMAYFVIYQLDMEAQVPLVMGLMLIVVVIAIFPWKLISERWNKGPAYALGMAIGGLAVALDLPPAPPADPLDLCDRGAGRVRLRRQLGVSLVHGARCGGLRPGGDRRAAERQLLRRLGTEHQGIGGSGDRVHRLDPGPLPLRAQRGADTADVARHPPVLRSRARALHRLVPAAAATVSDHPEVAPGDARQAGGKGLGIEALAGEKPPEGSNPVPFERYWV